MMGIQSLTASVLALLTCALALGAGDAKTPDDVLASKGLKKVGLYYVLDADANFPASLRTLRKAEKQLEEYIRRRREIDRDIERADESIAQWQHEMTDLEARRAKVPQSDEQKYNALVDAFNQRLRWVADAEKFQIKRAEDRRKLVAPVEHITLTVALAEKMEATAARYAQLASDPEVKASIDALNSKGGAKVRLGPSQQFKTELPITLRKRDALDAGALKMDTSHGVGIVNVTLNGTATVPMILDSGASYVCISTKVAEDIGLEVAADAPKIKATIANGSVVEVPVAMLSSVRLGKYVAHDVVCAVMPMAAGSNGPDCLLGGSFLKNFQYQIDLAAGVLHLTPITADVVGSDVPGSTKSGSTKSGTTKPAAPPTSQPNDAEHPPAADDPAKAVAPTPITLTIAADIDGDDDVFVSAAGLSWTHHSWNWPSDVVVNEAKWDPQAMPKLPPRGAVSFLDKVDWPSVQLESKTGRGQISLEPREDGVLIHFADPAAGAARYSVTLTFNQK